MKTNPVEETKKQALKSTLDDLFSKKKKEIQK